MKIFVTCMQCLQELGMPSFAACSMLDIPDEGFLHLTCDRGHVTVLVVQEERYQLLADLGIEAIAHEHYREAVTSFKGFLEELEKFAIRAIHQLRKTDPEEVKKCLDEASKFSPKGHKYFQKAWKLETGDTFAALPTQLIELRNRVTHAGRLITRAEAIAFAQGIVNHAQPILCMLGSDRFKDTLTQMTFDLVKRRQKASGGSTVCVGGFPHFITLGGNVGSESVEAAVTAFAERPNLSEVVSLMHGLGSGPFTRLGAP